MANQWDEGLLMKKKVEKKKPAKIAKLKPLKSKKPAIPRRQDQEKYRIRVENSQDGSFILKDGKVVLANKAFASMTGYHVNSLLGLDFKSLLVPEADNFLEQVGGVRSSGEFDLHLLHRDRRTKRFVRVSLRRIRYDGKTALLGAVRDQTELQKASEALARSERRYRELYDNLRDGFAVVNLKGQVVLWNRAFQEMLGYSEKELRKLSYHDITPEKWHSLEAKIIKEQVETKGHSDFYEKEYIRKDGSVFPVTLRLISCGMSRVSRQECGPLSGTSKTARKSLKPCGRVKRNTERFSKTAGTRSPSQIGMEPFGMSTEPCWIFSVTGKSN